MLQIYKSITIRIQQSRAIRGFSYWLDNIVNKRWYSYPFGKEAKYKKEVFIRLWEDEKKSLYSEIDSYELDKGYKIDLNWMNDLALHTQVVIKSSPLCWQHGRVLYTALSHWLDSNSTELTPVVTIWEIGTARGFSALCMSKAIEEQGRAGRIITFDVLPHNQKLYWNCIDDHDGPKTRSELLKPWRHLSSKYVIFHQGDSKITLKRVATERIHFAFLDGSHTYSDVMFEFNQIKAYQQPGDVIVFDDYSVSQFPGLVKAVDEICKDGNYLREDIFANKNRCYVIATKK